MPLRRRTHFVRPPPWPPGLLAGRPAAAYRRPIEGREEGGRRPVVFSPSVSAPPDVHFKARRNWCRPLHAPRYHGAAMVKLTECVVYIRTKASVENVRKLNLWGCDIDDIEICSRMKCIEVLSLSVNKISNLSPLRGCTTLTELYLRRNEIASLSELENLVDLKKLSVLWVDDNPCTAHSDYRYKVIRMLPQITKLDDKVVTMEEKRKANSSPSPPSEWIQPLSRLHSRHPSTATLVDQPMHYGKAIIDTMVPCQMPNYGDYGMNAMSQSMHVGLASSRTSVYDPMSQSVHPLMSPNSLQNVAMSQSFHPMLKQDGELYEDEVEVDSDWTDFSLEDDSRPKSMDGISERCNRNKFDQPLSARESSKAPFSGISQSLYRRSMSMPRRRDRTQSSSPAREQRHQKLLAAVRVLLDELDADGLRTVVDEAQKRLKKQR